MDLTTKNCKKNNLCTSDFDDFFKPIFHYNHNLMSMKTDIMECKDKYIVEVDLPGLDKKYIDLNIEDGYLNICVDKTEVATEKDKKGTYLRKERHYGSQCRSFYVGEVNEDNLSATYKNGILTITIPKKEIKEVSNKRRIEIQ